MKKEKNTILVSIIVLLVILIFLVTLTGIIKNNSKKESYGNITIQNGIIETDIDYDEVSNDVMTEKLLSMGERDRMEYYVSNFINLVEKKEYEKAYDLLYDEFKNNYFPTAGQFQTYAKKYFPSMASLDFTNIERNGDVYVLWVTITDPINGKKSEEGKEYNFVIRENNVNDIDLSFSVEEE
jgi:competence protein ComGC